MVTRTTAPRIGFFLPQQKGTAEIPLTKRENEVLKQMALGLTNKEIAKALGISYETIKEHVQHVLQKLDVVTAVSTALLHGDAGAVVRNDHMTNCHSVSVFKTAVHGGSIPRRGTALLALVAEGGRRIASQHGARILCPC